MNAAPISVNLAASGNASCVPAGPATKASTVPAFAQVMAQKQAEASAPKDTAAATNGGENANAANGSADAAPQKDAGIGPLNAKSQAAGTVATAKKGDAKGKSLSSAVTEKSLAQTPAQVSAQSAVQLPSILAGLNVAAPLVASEVRTDGAVIPTETAVSYGVSTAITGAAPTGATEMNAETASATPVATPSAREQGPATSELTKLISPGSKNLPVSVISAPEVPINATEESSAASETTMEAANGETTTPATASSARQQHAETPVMEPTPTTAVEPATLMNAASPLAAQSLPAAGEHPAALNPAANLENSTGSPTAAATSDAEPGDFGEAASVPLPAATAESEALNTRTAPKNQGRRGAQEILRGATGLKGKEAEAAAQVSVSATRYFAGTSKGKSATSDNAAPLASQPAVTPRYETPLNMKPEPVTQEVAAAPDKPASAKSRNNIKGNSSADVSVSGNSIGNSAGSTGNDKDFGVSADPPAAHSAMPAGQNDPVSLATGAVNAVPAPAGTLDKDSTSVSPVKAGGASITGAAAMPDADDAVPPLNESRVVNVAQMGGDQGHSQVRIAMQSDQLGQVELHATVRGQQVGAAITVEKKEAHAAMAAEMPSLQQALEDRQLRVGEVVLMQGAMHSTAGDAGNAAAEQQRRGQAGTTYQQLENETMYAAGGGTSFESSGIFDDSGRLSVRA